MNNKSGIYQIQNLENGKRYIGSSIDLEKRKRQHFRKLKDNKHENIYLQRAYNKYKHDSFEFSILEFCDNDDLVLREQFWIERYNFGKELYNICPVAGSCLGRKLTDKTREKMSRDRMGKENNFYGKTHSRESKERISKAATGRKVSKETKRKMAVASTGVFHTEETKTKIANAQKGELNHNYGKVTPLEVREKISQSLSGRPGKPLSEESKRKISEKNTGRIVNEETRTKISLATKGKPHTAEHTRKVSLANQKEVVCLDQNTNQTVSIYESVTVAAKSLGISKWGIYACCRGKKESYKGFVWEYLVLTMSDS